MKLRYGATYETRHGAVCKIFSLKETISLVPYRCASTPETPFIGLFYSRGSENITRALGGGGYQDYDESGLIDPNELNDWDIVRCLKGTLGVLSFRRVREET